MPCWLRLLCPCMNTCGCTSILQVCVLPGLATALMAARMLFGGGEVNTAPAIEPLSMPRPTNPGKKCQKFSYLSRFIYMHYNNTGELGYDRLNGTRKIGPSYAKIVVYI